MKALLQRVSHAEVIVSGKTVGKIDAGLLVYVGAKVGDTLEDAKKLAQKTALIRVFSDDAGKLNLAASDVEGGMLIIPNFSLYADTRKGRRPSFNPAASPDEAKPLFDEFLREIKLHSQNTAQGIFGAAMTINSAAEGPINVIIEFPPI